MKWTDLSAQPCSISRSLAVVGDRWTLLILRSAFQRARRFDDFQQQIGVTSHVLANRLDKLVKLGVMEKVLYQPWPARYEYRLTQQGRDLHPVLRALTNWGDKWLDDKVVPLARAPRVTAVILAGGRGRRMKGQDKGLMPWRGRPLAATLVDALRPQAAHVLINANRNRDTYAALGVKVIADTVPDFPGPLAGMLAGLRAAKTDAVLFVPCDTVSLPRDLVKKLLAANAGAAFASVGGEALYTCCLLRREHADAIEAALRDGQRAVRDFLAQQDAVAVDFPKWAATGRNMNRPEDLDVAV